MRKRFKELTRHAEAAGAEVLDVSLTQSGHIRVVLGGGAGFVVTPATPSCNRSKHKFKSDVRKRLRQAAEQKQAA